VLAEAEAHNGENVKLTIDSAIQSKLYDQMKNDKGTAVVMNPNTGEILALVSTPSYDPNDFILGLSEEEWNAYNNEDTRPMYNRFKATYAPGSSIKPVIAALGLSSGAFTADEDFGPSGTSWKKEGWNDYNITTLKQYSGAANVKNALVYSDNIYFAKAAIKIGGSTLADRLKSIGFGEEMPFEFGLSPSTFGKDLAFTDEIDVANSGFGQGKVEVNPIHMASIYSAFVNGGDMMTPYLESDKSPSVWKEHVFTEEAVNTVRAAMVQVIENPDGTGHSFKIDGMSIAGKTGTAEIKSSKEDTEGTELGWFVAYPADDSAKQYLAVAMIEDVKDRKGSHYVIPIVRSIFAD
jgi:penicillin-binding protein